jgi:hypothetical protein
VTKCWFIDSTCFGHWYAHHQEYNSAFRFLVSKPGKPSGLCSAGLLDVCVAVCWCVLLCTAVWCCVLPCAAVWCYVMLGAAVWCCVLPCTAVYCCVLFRGCGPMGHILWTAHTSNSPVLPLVWVSPTASFPQVSPPTPCAPLSPPPNVPHAPPISFFSI